MEYITHGGMKLSRLTLGTVQLGMDYGINNMAGKPDEATCYAVLKAALDGGVNVLDTASAYGFSEEIIGGFLKDNPQYKPIVVTKCLVSPDAKNPAEPSSVEKTLYAQAEASLKKLKLDKLPVLMLHSENEMFEYGDAVPNALQRLKAEGLIEHAGVSLNNYALVDDVARNGLYEAIQLPLNLMNAGAVQSDGVGRLQAAGKIVFARSVFLQGLFFKEPENLPAGILQKAAEPLRKLRAFAAETRLSIAELAFAFVRDLPGVASVVLGCETPEQAKANLALMDAPAISPQTRRRIITMFGGVDPRIAMPWTWHK